MSQLVYIDEAKALLGGLPSIFMPHSTIRGLRYPIQKFLFEQLVGPLTNLLSLADGESVRVRWLLVGHPTFYLRGGGKAMVSAGAIRYLNRRIRQQFSQFADQASPRNIYVTRDDGVAARHIENEPSVRQALKIHGFTPVTVSAHTPSEIIRLFYNAERIAGAHGAGLLNLIFSDSSNVQVLEMQLYPSNWNRIRVFSEALGVAFVGIPATRGAVPGSSGLVDENALTAALAGCGKSSEDRVPTSLSRVQGGHFP